MRLGRKDILTLYEHQLVVESPVKSHTGQLYTPDENGHPFRSKADSDSGVIRTLIPAQGGRIFRIAGIDIT